MQKLETVAERYQDDLYFMKDSFKQLQEERKRDIDETADFIKQVISQGKQETQGEI